MEKTAKRMDQLEMCVSELEDVENMQQKTASYVKTLEEFEDQLDEWMDDEWWRKKRR